MQKIRLEKNPGYVYDLFFIFFLRFNHEFCFESFVNKRLEKDDKAFYNHILKTFTPISDDLFVFFHRLENGRCFVTYNFFDRLKNTFTSNYGLDSVQNALSDYSDVTKQLIRFYFHELSEEDVEKCATSNVYLFDFIKKSNYSDTEKSRLYEFFMSPVPYIQKLQYELMVNEVKLASYYEKNYSLILDAYNGLTFETLAEQVKPLKNVDFIKNTNEPLILSFCLLNKNCLKFVSMDDGVVYLLGYDYLSAIDFVQSQNITIKLDEFATALAEENRIKMLDLMLERGEVSCKDFELTFSFSGSTAYHHLTVLMRYGIVKTRNEGKTILYSINRKYFDVVINILSKYSGGRKGAN